MKRWQDILMNYSGQETIHTLINTDRLYKANAQYRETSAEVCYFIVNIATGKFKSTYKLTQVD